MSGIRKALACAARKVWAALAIVLIALPSFAGEMLRVGLIDTGVDIHDSRISDVLCISGHRDFTDTTLDDKLGHGTATLGLIKQYAGTGNYCILVYKFYNIIPEAINTFRSIQGFQEAIRNGAKIINLSGGGESPSTLERNIIFSNSNVTWVVAAGNDGKELNKDVFFFPASYSMQNILSVGSLNANKEVSKSSNYGTDVKAWEVGEDVTVLAPNGKTQVLSGTSMSTAIRTGRLVKEYLRMHK